MAFIINTLLIEVIYGIKINYLPSFLKYKTSLFLMDFILEIIYIPTDIRKKVKTNSLLNQNTIEQGCKSYEFYTFMFHEKKHRD